MDNIYTLGEVLEALYGKPGGRERKTEAAGRMEETVHRISELLDGMVEEHDF